MSKNKRAHLVPEDLRQLSLCQAPEAGGALLLLAAAGAARLLRLLRRVLGVVVANLLH